MGSNYFLMVKSGGLRLTMQHKKNLNSVSKIRIRRISRGAGVNEKDVRELIAQWNRSRKMMKGIKGNRQLRKQMKSMMGDETDFDLPM